MPKNYLQQLTIKNQTHQLPIYLPDATLGVVRNVSSKELAQTGIEGVVINTYHLRRNPGMDVLEKAGIKAFMNWSGLTASDSGGFQLFSLINKNPKLGKITDEGVVLYSGPKRRRKELFTPEKSIQLQFAINSDIMICLDDFSPPEAGLKRLKASVDRSIDWAKRCKAEFERQVKKRKLKMDAPETKQRSLRTAKRPLTPAQRPLLFAVIQGHRNQNLRRYCAQKLLKIGFDGYGLGGWPFDDQGNFDYETCAFNATLTPDDSPRFALGVGNPTNITRLYQMGYHIFDCVLPTRDARHNRLYNFKKNPKKISILNDKNIFQYLYINRGAYKTDFKPISPWCDCFTCQNYSRAYLQHLFKIQDGLGWRLATIHNLRFYVKLIELLRESRK